METRGARDAGDLWQRREQRSGLRPFVLFWPVEVGWSTFCSRDRTAKLLHGFLDWLLGGPEISRMLWVLLFFFFVFV